MNVFPGRNQRGEDPYANVAHGEQIKSDSGRHGVVDNGCVAWPERVAEARRCWPEARPSDFERIGRRRFVDRATGRAYRHVPGAPLLAVGSESTRGISAWFVADGYIVCLEPEDFPRELLGPSGRVRSQMISAGAPGPEGPRIL